MLSGKVLEKNASLHSQILLFFFCFLGPHWWHMEVPRLGVEQELQLPSYATVTATPDPRGVGALHHR